MVNKTILEILITSKIINLPLKNGHTKHRQVSTTCNSKGFILRKSNLKLIAFLFIKWWQYWIKKVDVFQITIGPQSLLVRELSIENFHGWKIILHNYFIKKHWENKSSNSSKVTILLKSNVHENSDSKLSSFIISETHKI